MTNPRGSATVEFVLLTPVLVLLVVFVAAIGRSVDVSMSVRRAAEDAARAASMVSHGKMASTGRNRVMSELSRETGCLHPRAVVDLGKRGESRFVTVTASCDLNRVGVSSLFPFGHTFTSVSTEIVDVFTFR